MTAQPADEIPANGPDTAEENGHPRSAELVQMLAQKPRQLGMGGHDAAVSLSTVLELSHLAHAAIVVPLAARIGCRPANVQLTQPSSSGRS